MLFENRSPFELIGSAPVVEFPAGLSHYSKILPNGTADFSANTLPKVEVIKGYFPFSVINKGTTFNNGREVCILKVHWNFKNGDSELTFVNVEVTHAPFEEMPIATHAQILTQPKSGTSHLKPLAYFYSPHLLDQKYSDSDFDFRWGKFNSATRAFEDTAVGSGGVTARINNYTGEFEFEFSNHRAVNIDKIKARVDYINLSDEAQYTDLSDERRLVSNSPYTGNSTNVFIFPFNAKFIGDGMQFSIEYTDNAGKTDQASVLLRKKTK